MTIKQNGGIFGRNPEFNDVSAKDVSVTDEITILENGVDVGGVRSLSGQAQLSGTTTGITFGVQSVLPTNGGSAIQNGTRDIGGASNFWRNVYVSTGVYFGSQTTATHLDDYEEGEVNLSTTDANVDIEGNYVKAGRMVTVTLAINPASGDTTWATGDTITGLPYAAATTSSGAGGSYYGGQYYGGYMMTATTMRGRFYVSGTSLTIIDGFGTSTNYSASFTYISET